MAAGGSIPAIPFDVNLKPSCTRIVALNGDMPFLLPIRDMTIQVQVHVAVAFVRIDALIVNSYNTAMDCILEVPMTPRGTMSSATVFLSDGNVYDTVVMDTAVASEQKGNPAMAGAMSKYKEDGLDYNPDIFRLPFPGAPANSVVRLQVNYFENLQFRAGEYSLHIPLTFPSGICERPLPETVHISTDINTGTPDAQWGVATHPMQSVPPVGPVAEGLTRFKLQLTPGAPFTNRDFVVSYRAWSSDIAATALMEDLPGPRGERGGSFIVFMSPPKLTSSTLSFGRRMVFLLDNSGSMAGGTIGIAKQALIECLGQLQPNDDFAICVFNSRRVWWRPGMNAWVSDAQARFGATTATAQKEAAAAGRPPPPVPAQIQDICAMGVTFVPASPQNTQAAAAFVNTVDVAGMTDILTPIMQTTALVRGSFGAPPVVLPGGGQASHNPLAGAPPVEREGGPPPYGAQQVVPVRQGGGGGGSKVPIVFLLTDGAVPNEHHIVGYVKDSNAQAVAQGLPPTRLFTFGIGRWCNDYFLAQSAQVGRGYFESALRPEMLKESIVRLMEKASAPVLLDIAVGMAPQCYTGGLEVYPAPIPDLYCGAPVVVSGRCIGDHPRVIGIRGRLPDGRMWERQIPVYFSSLVPVTKVFARQQLDLLVSGHWLAGGDSSTDPKVVAMREKIVAISVANSVPCAHTAMVAFPTTEKEVEERRAAEADPAKRRAKAADPKAKKGGLPTGAKVALGVVAVGAAVGGAIAVGSLVAGGSGMVDGLGSVASGAGDMFSSGFSAAGGALGDVAGACNCCGADLSEVFGCCGDCGPVSGFLDNCFGDVGQFCGDACGCVPGCIGNIVGGAQDCLGQCASCEIVGACTSCAGGLFEGICGQCGDLVGSAGDCCGQVCGAVPECLGAAGGALSSVGDCCGPVFSACGDLGSMCGGCGDLVGSLGSLL